MIMDASEPRKLAQHKIRDWFARGNARQINVGRSERALSTAAGVGLAAYGAYRADLGGILLAGLGGLLAYRGFSGHCAGYARLGINTAKIGSAKSKE